MHTKKGKSTAGSSCWQRNNLFRLLCSLFLPGAQTQQLVANAQIQTLYWLLIHALTTQAWQLCNFACPCQLITCLRAPSGIQHAGEWSDKRLLSPQMQKAISLLLANIKQLLIDNGCMLASKLEPMH